MMVETLAKDTFGKGSNALVSKKLTGTNKWTKLSLSFTFQQPKPDTDKVLFIHLWHKGKGISYFDDVVLEGDVRCMRDVFYD